MAFIIPNATDTTSGNKYTALDQAEPDALDFEILGSRTTGVISGCEVAAQTAADLTVNVGSGYVVIKDVVYPVSGNATLTLGTAPVNNRFDLVIARLSSGVVSITTISGAESASNPTYPRSSSRLLSTSGVPITTYINPDTDVVLAAVYRSGGAAITAGRIVDKRVSTTSSIRLQGTTAPTSAVGSDGDLYFKSTITTGDSAGVFVKRSGAWQELAKASVDPGVPVGTIIMWPGSSTASVPSPTSASWLEADGSAVSRSTYSSLFAVLGTIYGAGDGTTTFNLPDFRGQFLGGLPATGRSMGTRYGASGNNTTLTTSNLPVHTHVLDTSATVSLHGGHSHTMGHEHPTASTSTANANHTHTVSGTTNDTTVSTNQNWWFTQTGNQWGYLTTATLQNNAQSTAFNAAHNHTFTATTDPSGMGHNHTVSVSAFAGSTGTDGSHSHTLGGTTASTGSGAAFSVEPSNYPVRFFIRYA